MADSARCNGKAICCSARAGLKGKILTAIFLIVLTDCPKEGLTDLIDDAITAVADLLSGCGSRVVFLQGFEDDNADFRIRRKPRVSRWAG
ncbi:MAG: hypothetical protein AAGE65_14175, partial [Planctomycetota bacterium]